VAYDQAFEDEHEFRRKVRTLAGNYQLFMRNPELLSPQNPVWFQLYSHKLLRLLCPWLLVVLFVSSWMGTLATSESSPFEATLMGTLTWMQALFYGLAAVGGRVGAVGRLARTFVVLNAAALVGLWRYARGRQKVTW
jgi:hypothetical protein